MPESSTSRVSTDQGSLRVLLAGHLAQPVAVVEGVSHPVAVGDIALDVVAEVEGAAADTADRREPVAGIVGVAAQPRALRRLGQIVQYVVQK